MIFCRSYVTIPTEQIVLGAVSIFIDYITLFVLGAKIKYIALVNQSIFLDTNAVIYTDM